MTEQPLIEFFCLLPGMKLPKRADRSAAGYLPSRAMRYCDAITSATSYGYWLFPPISFRLIWDGERVLWSQGEDEEWCPLSATDSGSIQFPDYSEAFDRAAPDYLRHYAPPFITALPEAGSVQIWSGLLIKTRPGWSVNVRSPINLPRIPGISTWEGIIETDLWLGPLFNNFRLTQTDEPVVFRAGVPFLQIQPVPQLAYKESLLADFKCRDVTDLTVSDWKDLSKVLLPSDDAEARAGDYAVMIRKRRSCPVAIAALVPSSDL